VLVRADLAPEQQTVQACHAVAEAVHHFDALSSIHPHLVICGVRDEAALLEAARDLKRQGVRARVFVEPDLGRTATALAAEPVRGGARRPFRRYPLLHFPEHHDHEQGETPSHVGTPRPAPTDGGDVMTTTKSRFGHHPCGYDTFL
jgi:hypothetical protein